LSNASGTIAKDRHLWTKGNRLFNDSTQPLDQIEVGDNSQLEQLNVNDLTLNGNVQPIKVGWTLPPQPFLGRMPDKVGFSSHNVHGPQNRSGQRTLVFLREQWQQLVADAVSKEIALCIRGILAERDSPLFREGSQGGFGLIEQRANQLNSCVVGRRTGPPHPGQAFPTRAAEQTKKEQLNLVIRMVGQRNGVDLQPPGRASQKVMAQLARGHFDRHLLPPGKRGCISGAADEAQAEFRCRFLDEPFVRVAFHPAQMMIEMGAGQPPLVSRRQRMENIQQDHRIQSAGDGD
jgi:hypothetical protein